MLLKQAQKPMSGLTHILVTYCCITSFSKIKVVGASPHGSIVRASCFQYRRHMFNKMSGRELRSHMLPGMVKIFLIKLNWFLRSLNMSYFTVSLNQESESCLAVILPHSLSWGCSQFAVKAVVIWWLMDLLQSDSFTWPLAACSA